MLERCWVTGREWGESGAALVVIFLAVWLIAPLCEEVIFRGVLWRVFAHWQWNRWVIFTVTSLVFAVAHLELVRMPLLLVLARQRRRASGEQLPAGPGSVPPPWTGLRTHRRAGTATRVRSAATTVSPSKASAASS